MKLKIQFGAEIHFDQLVGCAPEPSGSGHWHPGFITHTSVEGWPKPINPDLASTSGCLPEVPSR